nr:hypothetical protein [Tanacetum cinerariifolium]
MMKVSDIGIQEKKAKLFNEWKLFTSNEGELIESYYHRFLKLMNDLKRNKHFPEKIASNLKFLNNLQPEWSRHVTIVHQTKDLPTADYTKLDDFLKYNQKEVHELKAERLAKIQDPLALMANSNNLYASPAPHQDQSPFNQNFLQQPMTNPKDITDPTTAMNMALALMAKAFKLNYSTPTNNNQSISSNPRNRQIAQPGQNAGNLNGYNAVQNYRMSRIRLLRIQEFRMLEIRIDQLVFREMVIRMGMKEEAGIQLQAKEYDLMAATADLDEIEEVNANCILMANLQQASTSGTQTDSAPVYDSDGSAKNAGNLNGYNVVQNVENQVDQNLRVQNIGNQNGLIGVLGNRNQNQIRNDNLVAKRVEGNAAGKNGNQIRCYNYRGVGIQLQAEQFDLMAAATDLDEIEEVNANCILMANFQRALTLGTQTDKVPVFDSEGSVEVHNYENCYDNEIFNMFTQEEQYIK